VGSDARGTEVGSDARRKLLLTRSQRSRLRRRLAADSLDDVGTATPTVDAAISPVWEILPGLGHMSKSSGVLVSRRRDAMFRRTLALADLVGAYLALLTVVIVAGGTPALRPAAVLLAPFVLVLNKTIGLYDRDQHTLHKTTIDEAPLLVNMAVFYALVVWLTEELLLRGFLGRAQVLGLAVATFIFVLVGRSLARVIVLALSPPERCLVLGSALDTEQTTRELATSPGVKADVLGRLAFRADEAARRRSDVLGDVRSLGEMITRHSVERVIIAPDSHDPEEILEVIRLVKALGVKVSVLPRLLEVVGSSSTFDEVGGITLLGVRQYGLSKSSQFLKRTMDLVASAAGLLLLAPLLLLLGLAVKLDSRGPMFFRQPRVGRKGDRFDMFKFRSMVPDAERIKAQLREQNEAEGGLFKISRDPRVTRVGRFLRHTSLDELPQLLNVLRGEMSLVGPRPLVPDEDLLIEGWQRRRLAVKPGMTGLWQIFGSARIPMDEMVKIDYLYGANWSIWLDVKILIRTVPYVLHRRGL
jgi:exopolysaccharide biosynthesis polyprenyl glycosylphosphotransferase